MPKARKKGLKKAAKKQKSTSTNRVVKQDVIEVYVWRTGSQPWEKEIIRGVSFPEDVLLAQIEVESQESVEIKPNDWIRVRIAIRRSCVDTDEQVKLHMEKGWSVARGECKRILAEERQL